VTSRITGVPARTPTTIALASSTVATGTVYGRSPTCSTADARGTNPRVVPIDHWGIRPVIARALAPLTGDRANTAEGRRHRLWLSVDPGRLLRSNDWDRNWAHCTAEGSDHCQSGFLVPRSPCLPEPPDDPGRSGFPSPVRGRRPASGAFPRQPQAQDSAVIRPRRRGLHPRPRRL
jgi:hypothetical protein